MSLERFRRTKLVTLNRQSKAYQAARAMADNHIGAVLVSDPKGLAGIVTDRDLALAVLGHGLDPTSTALSEFMSEDVVACDIGSDIAHVMKLTAWRPPHSRHRRRPRRRADHSGRSGG
jgi:CBS domain-containing protein